MFRDSLSVPSNLKWILQTRQSFSLRANVSLCLTMFSLSTLILITVIAYILRRLIRTTFGKCLSERRLEGATALVTGANTGIGKETAMKFAERGARVILACRNQERGDAARREIIESTGNRDVHVRILDLACLASVRSFAHEIYKTERHLEILINNAGAFWLPDKKTSDGLNITLQVNHYGPFLLTNLLEELLKRSSPSRIIFVTSCVYIWAPPEMYDVNRDFGGFGSYTVSKLYNILISNCFARRLRNTGVTCNCVDPGDSCTDLYRRSYFFQGLMKGLLRILNKSASDAAETVLHAAISGDAAGVTGKYFANCKEAETFAKANDIHLAEALWRHSERAVGLNQYASGRNSCAVH